MRPIFGVFSECSFAGMIGEVMKDAERINGFDALRFCMVALVVVLHASMTFMEYAPVYWYVVDDQKSMFFTLLVIYLDCFPMSVLFFLAGYFSRPSFEKRGVGKFLLDKVQHIGLPWVLGVVFIAPIAAFMSYRAYKLPSVPPGEFLIRFFWGKFYQQAHYWFLGLLFFMFLCYALYAARAGNQVNGRPGKQTPVVLFAALWIISTVTYYVSTLIKPEAEWLNLGFILYFQPARISGYAALFAAGVYGYKKRWFTGEGWIPGRIVWGTVFFLFSMLFIAWNSHIRWLFNEPVNLWMSAFLYNTIAVLATIFLTALFFRLQKAREKPLRYFSPYSYGIYWLHMIVLMPVLYVLKPYSIPGTIKWVFSILFTLFSCRIVTKYVLRKTRLF